MTERPTDRRTGLTDEEIEALPDGTRYVITETFAFVRDRNYAVSIGGSKWHMDQLIRRDVRTVPELEVEPGHLVCVEWGEDSDELTFYFAGSSEPWSLREFKPDSPTHVALLDLAQRWRRLNGEEEE